MFRIALSTITSIFGEEALDLVLFVFLMVGILAIGVFVGNKVSFVLAAVLAFGYAWLLFVFRAKAVRWLDAEPFLTKDKKGPPDAT